MNLYDIEPGDKAYIKKLVMKGSMRRRLMDIGIVEGTKVECIGESPSGDPKSFFIRGAVIAIRKEDCQKIIVTGV